MATDCLFREDAYLRECTANVLGLTDQAGTVLDRTVVYATSGGQPGDRGMMTTASGVAIPMATAVYVDPQKTEIAHVAPAEAAARPAIGEPVTLAIDWDLRYARMRMHT